VKRLLNVLAWLLAVLLALLCAVGYVCICLMTYPGPLAG
jgi:hypothetical protein